MSRRSPHRRRPRGLHHAARRVMLDHGARHRRFRLRRSVQRGGDAGRRRADGTAARRGETVARRRERPMAARSTNSPRRRSATSRSSGRPRTATRSTTTSPPSKALISWDAGGYENQQFCGEDTYGLVNAGFCFLDNTIGWDRGELLPALRDSFGDIAVDQCARPRVRPRDSAPGQAEQEGHPDAGRRAAGRLLRRRIHALGGRGQLAALHPQHRRRAQQPTGGGDFVPRPAAERERTTTPGARRARLGIRTDHRVPVRVHRRRVVVRGDRREGDRAAPRRPARRAAAGPDRRMAGQRGVGEGHRRGARHVVLTGQPTAAQPSTRTRRSDCPDARPSPPVSYCPATNTIAVDMPELEELGTPSATGRERRRGVRRQHRVLGAGLAVHARHSAANAAAWRWTTPRPRCAPRA